jgi:murein DD-endopeptidase MepM/ murein hydrolase activator NlpD
MVRVMPWSWVLWALITVPVGWATVYGQETPTSADQVQEEFFEYRLRPGESLSDVARLFRLPVGELAQINRIADPTRLQAGQLLKVPNAFARQVAQVQAERNRFSAEKDQAEGALQEQQRKVAALAAELGAAREEKTALTRELATTLQWKQGTLALAVLFFGVLVWGLKLRAERARLSRQLTALTQETAALNTAKDKYRQAVAQLEFRYQKLVSSRTPVSSPFVTEGVSLLARAFHEGGAHLEQLLADITAEREREEQILRAQQKVFESVFHPLRGFRQRHGLKYHEV